MFNIPNLKCEYRISIDEIDESEVTLIMKKEKYVCDHVDNSDNTHTLCRKESCPILKWNDKK